MVRSALGAYSEIVAAAVAMITISAAILSRPLNFVDAFLDSLAILSIGAIFGSTATANGVKAGQAAIEAKLDTAATIAASTAATVATDRVHEQALRDERARSEHEG